MRGENEKVVKNKAEKIQKKPNKKQTHHKQPITKAKKKAYEI